MQIKPKTKYPNLKPENDGRRKIQPSQYKDVKRKYKELKSYRATARFFDVDKGTIKAIIYPDWYIEKQQKRYAKKPWIENYQKVRGEEWNRTMREHRAKKGKLQPDEMRKYRHAKRGKIFNKIPCVVCGEMFLPRNYKQKTCSRRVKPCYYKYYRSNKKTI